MMYYGYDEFVARSVRPPEYQNESLSAGFITFPMHVMIKALQTMLARLRKLMGTFTNIGQATRGPVVISALNAQTPANVDVRRSTSHRQRSDFQK